MKDWRWSKTGKKSCITSVLSLASFSLHTCCVRTSDFLSIYFFLLILPYWSSIPGHHLRILQQLWVASNIIISANKFYIDYFRIPLNLEYSQWRKSLHIAYRAISKRTINIILQVFIIILEMRLIPGWHLHKLRNVESCNCIIYFYSNSKHARV